MAITVFKVFVWFLCIFEITDCQTIRVTSGKEMSAMVSRFCPHFIAAEVDDASLLLWSDLYFNQLVIPGANHLSQNVQPDYSGANLTFSFVMESQSVMLVATREDEIITRIFHIVVEKASGPIQVTTSSGDIQQVDYSMGDEVDITCAVSTCRRMAYTVQVVGPNNRTLQTWNGIFDQGVNNFTLGMAVSPDYAGQYKCTVKATLNGHAFALSSAASITAQQGVVLTSIGELCFGQTVTLTCTHPDPLQDPVKYIPQVVAWAENDVRLDFTLPATHQRFTRTRLSNTVSTLSFTVTEEDHANVVVNDSCFLALTGGGREESNRITIDINAPPIILSTPDSTSGLLQWNPSPSCGTYNYQYNFTLTWVRMADGSTGTVSTEENRFDFTGMPGGEYTAALTTRVTNFNGLIASQPAHGCWITIIQPPTILSTPNSTSGLLQWRPSSNCSNYRYIFTLTWVRIGDGSTGTVSTEENRYDFTGMPGGNYTARITAAIVGLNLLNESEPLIVPAFTTPMRDVVSLSQDSFIFITAVSAVAGLFVIIIMVLAVIIPACVLVRMRRRRRREEGQERKRRADPGEDNIPPVPMTTNPSYAQVQYSTEKRIPLYGNL